MSKKSATKSLKSSVKNLYQKDLFDKMIQSIAEFALHNSEKEYESFGSWFSSMYFPNFEKCIKPDGGGDGKVDFIAEYRVGKEIKCAVINAKYTSKYNELAPPEFYSEALDFHNFFNDKKNRSQAKSRLRKGLVRIYDKLFNDYDNGDLELIFLTTHKKNKKYHKAATKSNLKYIHLEDLLEYFSEFIEGEKPVLIEPLILSGISTVLTADESESNIPTSIVFARIIDFVKYMKNDTLDLLFARNVRLFLGETAPNKEIMKTYEDAPEEFVYSNNGITLLCKS